jgi:hypothetical protein
MLLSATYIDTIFTTGIYFMNDKVSEMWKYALNMWAQRLEVEFAFGQ